MKNRKPGDLERQKQTPTRNGDRAGAAPCMAQAVQEVMRENQGLKAVKVDPEQGKLVIGTEEAPEGEEIGKVLESRFARISDHPEREECKILMGRGDCSTCSHAPSPDERVLIRVGYEDGRTVFEREDRTKACQWHWKELKWPRWEPRKVLLPDEAEYEQEWKSQLIASILCGVFGLTAYQVSSPEWSLPWFLASYLAGSWYTVQEVWERLQQRVLDVHFLMLAVAAGSASIGAWAEGAVLLFLFSFSGALEHYAMGRTEREIRSLFRQAPKTANRLLPNGEEERVAVESLRAADRLLVRPGEQFPVDAEVIQGATASDESNLTGEAVPVEKEHGDRVFAGTLNLWGGVEVKVLKPAKESALQKIILLIREAQKSKAPSQRFTDRFGSRYTIGVLALSGVMFFVWWLGMGHPAWVGKGEQTSAFYRTMTLLVVASPCALVLSIPSAILAAIAWAARAGVLFRGGAAVEKLAEVGIVAMDKTGTLTTGDLRVDRVESFVPGQDREVMKLAYKLERLSTHPLARAIQKFCRKEQIESAELEKFRSETGQGLEAMRNGRRVRLGKRTWVESIMEKPPSAESLDTVPGFSEIWVAEQGGIAGRILLRDEIRPESAGLIQQLKDRGLRTVVLTGDRKASGDYLRERIGVDEVQAEMHPDEKVAWLKEEVAAGGKPVMIGDGVNDAPALAAAHVGVAMGARGSDTALEQADVVLMHDRLENFLVAYSLSEKARVIIRQNLVISLGTVLVLVGLAALGWIPLTVGVVGHEGSTVVVVLNSLRLFRVKHPRKSELSGAFQNLSTFKA